MSDDRRYKQRGYQERDERPSRPSQGFSPEGKRLPVITAYKETVRCAECGQDLSTAYEILMESKCPKCAADLHTCRNCRHFDTASRFECTQSIKARVGRKAERRSARQARSLVERGVVGVDLGLFLLRHCVPLGRARQRGSALVDQQHELLHGSSSLVGWHPYVG